MSQRAASSPSTPPEASGPAPGSREAGKLETRQALLEAALAEFSEKGLDAPSLDAICARAGKTRGAFYVHFRDRDELVAAAMEHVLGALLDAVIGRGDGEPDLDQTLERYVRLAAQGRENLADPGPADSAGVGAVLFHQVMAACRRSETTRRRFAAVLAEARDRVGQSVDAAQRGARVRQEPDPRDLGQLLVLLALGVRAAVELELPVDVARTESALKALLAPAEGRSRDGG